MSKSVKLSNGDYIDAGAVWDNTQGKTVEAINNQGAVKFKPTGADVKSYTADRCTMWRRKGMIIVTFNVVLKDTLVDTNGLLAQIINASDLGLTQFDCAAMNAIVDFKVYQYWVYARTFAGDKAISIQSNGNLASTVAYGSLCIPLLTD